MCWSLFDSVDGLKFFFLSCSKAETSKLVSILQRLENPLTKPLLLFLSYILPPMDKFNRLFQKSTQNTTCQLYTEMSRLVRLHASNLLKPECIVAVGDDLSQLNLATRNQLADENLGLGDATWTYISGMEEELDPKTLYKAVRSFYVASLQKMQKIFPFGDSIFQDLGIINPDQVCSYDFTTVERLAKRFHN